MAESEKRTEALIMVGSPREDGRSHAYASAIAAEVYDAGVQTCLFELAKYPIVACNGCKACQRTGACVIVGDSWNVLAKHIESCDTLVLVAPVYFAGPSACLKAALDRFQVYWSQKYVLKNRVLPMRPARLVVIGDGGDPFGSKALETICTSALNCANLRIIDDRIHRFIGVDFDTKAAERIACLTASDACAQREGFGQ